MNQSTPPSDGAELEHMVLMNFANLFDARSKSTDSTWADKLVKEQVEAIQAHTAAEVAKAREEAEDRVLAIAQQPCECGEPHKAHPVRSVTGAITHYCQFSRVRLAQLPTQGDDGGDSE